MTDRDAFICHASEDKAVARSFALGLAQFGVTTWLDEAEMRPGDRLVDKLAAGIHNSRWFIILLTNNSVNKRWVQFELSQAIDREVRDEETVVVPVVLSDCEVPAYLRNKIYVDLRDFGNYEHGIQQLANTIKGDILDPPSSFVYTGIESMTDEELLTLPRSQAILEHSLRAHRWSARRLRTLSHSSGLLPKQVITYCERMPHIVVSPFLDGQGNIYYGRRDRIVTAFSSEEVYISELHRLLRALRAIPSQVHPLDVMLYFFSFHP